MNLKTKKIIFITIWVLSILCTVTNIILTKQLPDVPEKSLSEHISEYINDRLTENSYESYEEDEAYYKEVKIKKWNNVISIAGVIFTTIHIVLCSIYLKKHGREFMSDEYILKKVLLTLFIILLDIIALYIIIPEWLLGLILISITLVILYMLFNYRSAN